MTGLGPPAVSRQQEGRTTGPGLRSHRPQTIRPAEQRAQLPIAGPCSTDLSEADPPRSVAVQFTCEVPVASTGRSHGSRGRRHPGRRWWLRWVGTLVLAVPSSDREEQRNSCHEQLDRSCARMCRVQEDHGDHENGQCEPAEPEDRNPVHRWCHGLLVPSAPSTDDRRQPQQKSDRDFDEQHDQAYAATLEPSLRASEGFPGRQSFPGKRGTRELGSKRMVTRSCVTSCTASRFTRPRPSRGRAEQSAGPPPALELQGERTRSYRAGHLQLRVARHALTVRR
jgi:hypothetical protein